MNTKTPRLLKATLFVSLLFGSVAAQSDKIPAELIGAWNWKSLSALRNHKPFGTVNLRPGQSKSIFNPDGTSAVETTIPAPHQLNGSYQVRGHDLEMKRSDGKPYTVYQFKIEKAGKELLLQNEEQRIVASRE